MTEDPQRGKAGEHRAPARPRHAASLILLRPGRDGIEVLMGRRGRNARFMPGRYVFPGGGVAPEDRRPWLGETGHPPGAGWDPTLLRLARAALRETFEETGLVLGRPATATPVDGTPRSPIERAYLAQRALPDFEILTYIGRAITPTSSPMRFHARFFLGDGSNAMGALVENGELEDLRWRPIDVAADDAISDVTRFMLGHAHAVWQRATAAVALYRYVNHKARITRHEAPPNQALGHRTRSLAE
jgi:8-oxo-dGTP pyrophosphatase MutT (NUDIX family)